jgi:hypothetical protein
MTATILKLPGVEPRVESAGIVLSDDEILAITGYRRPADQLKRLHEMGFERAFIAKVGRKRVILDRAHHDAVTRGQYGGKPAANEPTARAPLPPNRSGYRKKFGKAGA